MNICWEVEKGGRSNSDDGCRVEGEGGDDDGCECDHDKEGEGGDDDGCEYDHDKEGDNGGGSIVVDACLSLAG